MADRYRLRISERRREEILLRKREEKKKEIQEKIRATRERNKKKYAREKEIKDEEKRIHAEFVMERYISGNDHISVIKNNYNLLKKNLTPNMYDACARHRDVKVAEFLLQKNMERSDNACKFAALSGCLEIFAFFMDNGFAFDSYIATSCVMGGNLECLEYAISKDCDKNFLALITAVNTWNVEMLDVLFRHEFPYKEEFLCTEAADQGNLEALRYLRKKGFKWNSTTLVAAEITGSIECFRYIWEEGCSLGIDKRRIGYNAAAEGHLPIVSFLVEKGVVFRKDILEKARRNGQMEVYNYLYPLVDEMELLQLASRLTHDISS